LSLSLRSFCFFTRCSPPIVFLVSHAAAGRMKNLRGLRRGHAVRFLRRPAPPHRQRRESPPRHHRQVRGVQLPGTPARMRMGGVDYVVYMQRLPACVPARGVPARRVAARGVPARGVGLSYPRSLSVTLDAFLSSKALIRAGILTAHLRLFRRSSPDLTGDGVTDNPNSRAG